MIAPCTISTLFPFFHNLLITKHKATSIYELWNKEVLGIDCFMRFLSLVMVVYTCLVYNGNSDVWLDEDYYAQIMQQSHHSAMQNVVTENAQPKK